MGEFSIETGSHFLWSADASRSDQAEQEGTDFVTIANASQTKIFPASDLHDWTARYNTIKRLADDMVKEFRKKAPVQANQTLLTRLQTLESENARLKGQISRSSRPDAKPPSAQRCNQGTVGTSTPEEDPPGDDGEDTADFGSGPPLVEDTFASPDRENDQDPSKVRQCSFSRELQSGWHDSEGC